MKNKVLMLFFVFFIVQNMYSQKADIIKSFNLPKITEQNEGQTYSLMIEKGVPYILGTISCNNLNEQYKVLFILDTGIAYSYLYSNNLENLKIDKKQYGQDNYLLCSVDFQEVNISAFYLLLNQQKNTKVFNCNYDLIGVLGNDVLTQKSFYISLTKKEFAWKDNTGINAPSNTDSYYLNNISMERGGVNYYWHTVFVEDDFFNNRTYPLFQMMPEQRGSRYWLGTGSYEIITTDFDFEEQIDRHNYKNTIKRNQSGKIDYGLLIIKKANFFGKKFKNLTAVTSIDSFYGLAGVKILGTQVLSAFDIYFVTGNDNKITKVFFYPVNDKEYKKFLDENK